MAKKKKTDAPRSMEEMALKQYQDRKKRIHKEAKVAIALMADKRFPILEKFLQRESHIAAMELQRLLKYGTKRVKKGDAEAEETLDSQSQLIEAKCLAWKCNFLNAFAIDPANAVLQKEELDEYEQRVKEEQ